jgi:hypothetical protein
MGREHKVCGCSFARPLTTSSQDTITDQKRMKSDEKGCQMSTKRSKYRPKRNKHRGKLCLRPRQAPLSRVPQQVGIGAGSSDASPHPILGAAWFDASRAPAACRFEACTKMYMQVWQIVWGGVSVVDVADWSNTHTSRVVKSLERLEGIMLTFSVR